MLLSGAGGRPCRGRQAAGRHAGRPRVIAAFESILGTNPSGAQLTQWVHKLHGGVSIKALAEDLSVEARVRTP